MSIQIQIKPIPIRKSYKTADIRRQVMAMLESAGARAKSDLNQITGTWNHPVNFKVEVRIRFGDAAVRVTTDDDVFHYLNEGTSVRYALMSGNWRSKTKPGRMRSGSGSGSVVYIGKKKPWRNSRKRWPRPGIKARGWMSDVQRNHTRRVQSGSIQIFKGRILV